MNLDLFSKRSLLSVLTAWKTRMRFDLLDCLSHLLVHVVEELLPHKTRTSDNDSLHHIEVDVPQYVLYNLT